MTLAKTDPSFAAVRGVMIDLDGTMVDSVPDLANAANATLEMLGLPTWPVATVRGWVGNGVPRLIHRSITGEFEGEADPEVFAKAEPYFMDYYRDHLCVDSVCYEGVEETLDTFARIGIKMACVTNKPEALSVSLLEMLGVAKHFTTILGGDSLPTRKPDPAPLYEAAKQMGFDISECVLIGDSTADVRGAANAGCRCVCVSYGYNQGVDMSTLGPDFIVDKFASALDCFESFRIT